MGANRGSRRKEIKLKHKRALLRAGIMPSPAELRAEPPAEVVNDIFMELIVRGKTTQEVIQEKTMHVRAVQERIARFAKIKVPTFWMEITKLSLAHDQESLRIFQQIATRFTSTDDCLHFVSRNLPKTIEAEMRSEKAMEQETGFPRSNIPARVRFLLRNVPKDAIEQVIMHEKERLEKITAMRDFVQKYGVRISGKHKAFLEQQMTAQTSFIKALGKYGKGA
jgi:hypothetical protein